MSSRFALWWRAFRPHAYPASVVPALVGAALAWQAGYAISWGALLLTIIGVAAAQTGGNLLNDVVDFAKGVDRPGTLGGAGILVEGLLRPRQVLVGAIAAFVVAAAAGVPLVLSGGWPIAALAVFGALAAVGYVAPPLGLKYRAMGDATVLAVFGIGITLGSYLVQTGTFAWAPVAAGAAYGLWVVALLHCNNIRDLADDAADGTRTVAGMLGPRGARRMYAALVLGAYALVALFAAAGVLPRGVLLCFLTLPLGMTLVVRVLPASSTRAALAEAWPRTAQYALYFGLAMVAGIVIQNGMR